jgi:hypothetical protein
MLMTGQTTVPNIFIDGAHIGGNSELQALHSSGKLVEKLTKAGLKVTEPVGPKNPLLGHFVNWLVIINAVVFLGVVYAQEMGKIDLLDLAFLKDGFCISNKDMSIYYQSHALCFYADTAMCVVLWMMAHFCKGKMSDVALDPVKGAIMGIFGHGCGHLYLATKEETPMEMVPWERYDQIKGQMRVFCGLGAFWFFFIRSMSKNSGTFVVLVFSLIYNCVHVFYVQNRFAFTYVQTVLMLHQAISQLIGEKGEYYTEVAVMISLPVGLVGWVEACLCSSFLVKIGGHLWFDLSIPLSMCVYFLYVRSLENSKSKVSD